MKVRNAIIKSDAPLKPEGKAAHATITMFLTYLTSMLSIVILQWFDAVGWATGRASGL